MRGIEIVRLANKLRNYYCTNNPLKLCKLLNFSVREINLNPKVYKAYITNPLGDPIISINKNYTEKSQRVLCAHELGHAILHKNSFCNEFGGTDTKREYEANLFAVALLFNENQFDIPISKMSNYMLQEILNCNIELR